MIWNSTANYCILKLLQPHIPQEVVWIPVLSSSSTSWSDAWSHVKRRFLLRYAKKNIKQRKVLSIEKKSAFLSYLLWSLLPIAKIVALSFCFPPPCRWHSPPNPLRVAAQEALESRQHTGSRSNIAPSGVIMIRLLSWSRREVEGPPDLDFNTKVPNSWFQLRCILILIRASQASLKFCQKCAGLGPR